MSRSFLKAMVPARIKTWVRSYLQARQKARFRRLPKLSEADFRSLLQDRLGLRHGDVVFVHSSTDRLNLSFSLFRILPLLLESVGPDGTVLFPTYPRQSSYQFLLSQEVFDVRTTPSFTGIVSELARRDRRAVRSLHPTKSVCAIGPRAEELTAEHHRSPYPYGPCSPYAKIVALSGKIVGLGVRTANMSFAHCVDDALGADFPVAPYHPDLFGARCLDRAGQLVTVETYAHDMRTMAHDVPSYVRRHIDPAICRDFEIHGMPFFVAQAQPLFAKMIELAHRGITIYPRRVYRRASRGTLVPR